MMSLMMPLINPPPILTPRTEIERHGKSFLSLLENIQAKAKVPKMARLFGAWRLS